MVLLLEITMRPPINNQNYSLLPLRELAILISDDYHAKLKEAMETVLVQLDAAHHIDAEKKELGLAHDFIIQIRDFFLQHAGKEERFLFPLLNNESGKRPSGRDTEELRRFINELKAEHRQLMTQLTKLRSLTNTYNATPMASPSQKLAYAQMNDFEQDVNRLIYIEEEFLFPRLLSVYQKNNPPKA